MPALYLARVVLIAREAVRLQAHHAGVIYALLAAAHGRARYGTPEFPENIWPETPEQCRCSVLPDEPYAFGLTLLAKSGAEAAERLRLLLAGLEDVGNHSPQGKPVWGGNFRVASVEDRVAAQRWKPGKPLVAVSSAMLEREAGRIGGASSLTLHFHSPLRCERGDRAQQQGHRYFDRQHFDGPIFLQRVAGRLQRLGLHHAADRLPLAGVTVAANRLVWLDLSYGPPTDRQAKGGVMGAVTLAGLPPAWLPLLVLGQYARVGESTKFGFGSYRIAELGPDPFPCQRGRGLLQLAATYAPIASLAEEFSLDQRTLRRDLQQLAKGDVASNPPMKLRLPKPDGGERLLAIPSRRDRALQRAVLDVLAPGLDHFFENSSLAYRRGLGRHRAAVAVRQAYRDGYAWAVKSDVHHFFDEVDHVELAARLEAYLADPPTVRVLMTWVLAGAPSADRGLPTGSPLSPLLANIFLDQFDERIDREGGRLVRYADDFLILSGSKEDADRLFAQANQAAAELLLTLNAEKSALIDLAQPFRFLGFRFAPSAAGWSADAEQRPVHLPDLGWEEAPRQPPPARKALPGEAAEAGLAADEAVVLGPGLEGLFYQEGHLLPVQPGADVIDGVPLDRLREVVLLGPTPLGAGVLEALATCGANLILADPSGAELGHFVPADAPEDPEVLLAQASALANPDFRLSIARALIGAKVANYATLALAYPTPADPEEPAVLRIAAGRCAICTNLDELRGVEGAAAARWYAGMEGRLPNGFHFQRRVAPDAADPVNILLNMAQTSLYRHCVLAARSAGLSPSWGIFHERRAGFAALAADLQEPFRHLMDRVVLEATSWLRPSDFLPADRGKYALVVRPGAAREFAAAIARQLAWPMLAPGESEARPYRLHLHALARSLRRCLLEPTRAFRVLVHAE